MIDLNPLMDRTTVKIVDGLHIPRRTKGGGVYIPIIPFIPFILIWFGIAIVAILVFGGFVLLIGKEQEFFKWWF